MKASSYEYLSKAVHLVMSAAGVHKGNSVMSIRKSSITKTINQGATIQEISRASRHKDGSNTVAVHYDMNLNDTIRERLTNFELHYSLTIKRQYRLSGCQIISQ
ncbi:MAG: hypothetical protein EZS28_001768 [Streblomastix strix]|uniref:Tyr recombinase domain-containing protein n=1 Tax=Streblomastix strix TaxID=222440 RepID=A0A5J4X630_9EUKA|nr:MAG: hypothetical protein EZS28_001768 [Streblomastix strix]